MISTSEALQPSTYSFHDDVPLSLGLKELIFLAFILLFGFCGFTVCLDKIYNDNTEMSFNSITVHDRSLPANVYHNE